MSQAAFWSQDSSLAERRSAKQEQHGINHLADGGTHVHAVASHELVVERMDLTDIAFCIPVVRYFSSDPSATPQCLCVRVCLFVYVSFCMCMLSGL